MAKARNDAARATARKALESEAPGDPRYPATFINIKSNEQKLAAHLGFDDVSDPRRLAIS